MRKDTVNIKPFQHAVSGATSRAFPLVLAFAMFLAWFLAGGAGPGRAGEGPGTVPASGLKPEIYDLTVNNASRRLLAYFSLRNGLTPEILDALKSGISVKYVFDVELLAPGGLWKRAVASRKISRTLSYDSLKGEYRVMFGPVVSRVVGVRTLEEAERLVCNVDDVPLVPLEGLQAGVSYTLRVRARADKSGSSLPFEGLLRFFSSWGFETRWYEIRFRY